MNNITDEFRMKLKEVLEEKAYFGRRQYKAVRLISFPPLRKRSRFEYLRIKPAIFYEYSCLGITGSTLIFNNNRRLFTEIVRDMTKYENIAIIADSSPDDIQAPEYISILVPNFLPRNMVCLTSLPRGQSR